MSGGHEFAQEEGDPVKVFRVDDNEGSFISLTEENTGLFVSFSPTVAAALGRCLIAMAESEPASRAA